MFQLLYKIQSLTLYGWNIYIYQLQTILSTTYETHIFYENLKSNGFKLIGQRSSLFSKLLIIWIKEELCVSMN
jgi:hypothetical protein